MVLENIRWVPWQHEDDLLDAGLVTSSTDCSTNLASA